MQHLKGWFHSLIHVLPFVLAQFIQAHYSSTIGVLLLQFHLYVTQAK